jgi:signal transduction histidine kinase/CheY-like chemotaxis protein
MKEINLNHFLEDWKKEINLALENSNCYCIALFDLEGNLLFANHAMKSYLSESPKESLLNPSFDTLVATNSDNSLIYEGILTLGKMTSADNVSILAKIYKNKKELLILSEPNISELITVNKKLFVLNNEINDLQRSLLKSKKDVEVANRAKTEFLMNMSHEIRNPLNGVIGFTDLLLKTNLDDSQRTYIDIVFRSANSLLDLLNEVLDFSKIQSGKMELNIEKVDLHTLIEHATDLLKYKLIEKKLNLLIYISPDLPKFIFVDSIRLRQILINLMSNAAKFTHHGEIEIEAKLTRLENNKKAVIYFAVRDTGIGISKENQSKIFEAFTQADSSINRKYGGSGLGLSISNKLLALMSSKLELESEEGKGSKFFFNLTVDVDMEEPIPVTIPSVEILNPYETKSIINEKISVLLVDDDEINLFLTKSILKKVLPNGIIFEALNGLEAIELYQREIPDIIFMDVQMPELNGYETTLEIRNLNKNKIVPIIALTAGVRAEDIEQCFQVGMNDFVSKPIVAETIEKILFKWLNQD